MRIETIVLLLAALLAVACGNAVTNPAYEGFDANPRPVQGDWATLFRTQGGVTRYDAELLPAGGEFLGRFVFYRFGQVYEIQFTKGTWDGTRLRFTTAGLPGTGSNEPLEWIALYLPAGSTADDAPDRLRLSSPPIGGAGFPVEYVRPADLEFLEAGL